jgi:hypothetical protein
MLRKSFKTKMPPFEIRAKGLFTQTIILLSCDQNFGVVRLKFLSCDQGCQMVCFQTKNPNIGKIWRALE